MSKDKMQKILQNTAIIMVCIICIEIISLLIWKFDIIQIAKDNGMDILAFLGAIIGGAITYIGVKTTIKHEQNIRKQEENQKNIKLVTDVLNELRDDFNQIENITYEINYVTNLYMKLLEKEPMQNLKQILEQQGEQKLEQKLNNSIEIVEETANKINLKLKKLLDEKIIYFDWKVFENIELYNLEIEKINLKETFEDEETKKIFTTQRLNVCTNIIKELKNYQAYLREQMRKK